MHGFRHAGIYIFLGLLDDDDDDLLDYTTTDESNIEVTETNTPHLLVSDVYTNSQTEEEELKADETDSETNDIVIMTVISDRFM